MGWVFLFVVAAMLVWLFMESGWTRMAALGLIAFVAVVVTYFFLVLDAPERRAAEREPLRTETPQANDLRDRVERSRTALTPASIAMTAADLSPKTEVYWASDGKQHERVDLYSWTFSAGLRNLSDEFTARDVYIRVRLFSCPSFFKPPSGEAVIEDLERRCSKIGDRTSGFYNVDLQPGADGAVSEPITFDNQPEPRNWRFWANVSRVDARIE